MNTRKRNENLTLRQAMEKEYRSIDQAIDAAIAQGLVVQLPNGNVALTKAGQLAAELMEQGRRSTKQ